MSIETPQSAVIVGCARDCAAFLPSVFENFARLSSLFERVAFVIVENDSKDATKNVLARWAARQQSALVVDMDGLASQCPIRTARLEAARNRCLAETRTRHLGFDLLIKLDCDDVAVRPLDLDAVRRSLAFLNADPACAGVFANQIGTYYDMWAFRHPERCPGDVWEDVLDCVVKNKVRDDEAFQMTFAKRIFSLPISAEPLEVNSAFGGLGIYKMPAILGNHQSYRGYKLKSISTPAGIKKAGWQQCEHVSFHEGLREQGGRLFVLPWLINASRESVYFPPSAYRSMLFDPALVPSLATAGRNDACPCGSGRKFKVCHGRN